MQWNRIPRFLNLYAIILGYSGVTKSGSVRECREALEELYEFLIAHNIGNPSAIHSILDKFTEAGFMDQLKESTNIIIIQEEVDVALKQMSFFSNNTPDSSRQMFCQLFDGLTMRKKTKGYRQRIRNARMTICGTSTGVLLPPILQDFLKHVMTDGVVVRCLFLVLGYQQYLRQQHVDPNQNMPTVAQMLMAMLILGRRQYVYSHEAQLLLDSYIEELSKQASEANSSRITSFLAKQAIQVTRISTLTQIIDLLPSIIEHANIIRAPDDMIGLNLRLYNEIDMVIRRLFEPQITITKASTSRAIYFHGYLLEQTLKVFDISSLETVIPNMNPTIGKELCRQILMLPQIIITKENLYSFNEKKRIDRNIGTQSFETLVTEGLLLKDYFILTSTRRPIECYAKILPTNQMDRDVISNKLRIYNIQLSAYIDVSRSVGIQPPSKLSAIGTELFSRIPYSTIYNVSTSSSELSISISSSETSSSNNNPSITTQTRTQTISINENDELPLPSHAVRYPKNFIERNNYIIIRNLFVKFILSNFHS
ncbi:unnamed protein product [Rotaria sordida]|uniref:Uncharacterized protein n=1 Tax=Rotaria sordida TaxID=392033 RepID=A0A814HC14_9BILA|nr:unnamed protein product [Rotaria sordida]CAF1381600.1 unnamed protein product [Rotaria sordida]